MCPNSKYVDNTRISDLDQAKLLAATLLAYHIPYIDHFVRVGIGPQPLFYSRTGKLTDPPLTRWLSRPQLHHWYLGHVETERNCVQERWEMKRTVSTYHHVRLSRPAVWS